MLVSCPKGPQFSQIRNESLSSLGGSFFYSNSRPPPVWIGVPDDLWNKCSKQEKKKRCNGRLFPQKWVETVVNRVLGQCTARPCFYTKQIEGYHLVAILYRAFLFTTGLLMFTACRRLYCVCLQFLFRDQLRVNASVVSRVHVCASLSR